MKKILVSACVLGENCKYNGGNNFNKKAVEYVKDKDVITICPELLSGLPTPRNCVEFVDGRLIDDKGNDVDDIYKKGVKKALDIIKHEDIELCILQSRSPTCGVNKVYDGTFSGKLIEGQGLFAKELIKLGIKVIDIEDL